MSQISLDQLDEFGRTYLVETKQGDVPQWNVDEEKLEPVPELKLRRIFMLMGA